MKTKWDIDMLDTSYYVGKNLTGGPLFTSDQISRDSTRSTHAVLVITTFGAVAVELSLCQNIWHACSFCTVLTK